MLRPLVCLQDTRRVQACPLDGSAEAPALAAALLWRQKQFADFLGSQEVQVGSFIGGVECALSFDSGPG